MRSSAPWLSLPFPILAGKDSQSMTILLSRATNSWRFTPCSARSSGRARSSNIEAILPVSVPLIFSPVAYGKALLEWVEERGLWPSSKARWCTSLESRAPRKGASFQQVAKPAQHLSLRLITARAGCGGNDMV